MLDSDSRKRSRLQILLRSSASMVALASALVAVPALAQTPGTTGSSAPVAGAADDGTEVEEVVVTGIRAALRSSQAIKKNAEVFVDSITAEDIGALPDRSVTEALQRVPGVSINRFAAGVDPDHFSVEGSGVVVRGLNFVRSELNGRDIFAATNGRGLGFADVPSELMGGVDVFKSPSADMVEGGISGTVNLRTRVPFDGKGRVLAASAELSYGDFVEKSSPTYSILYSDRWQTGVGEFGLLLNYVDSELKSRSDGTQISNFGARTNLVPGQTVYFPRGAAFRSQVTDRERKGYAGAAQWRNDDHTAIATLQFLRSESSNAWTEHAMEIATDNVTSNGDSRPVAGTTFGFDERGVFTNGIITGTTGWRDDQFGPDPRTPIDGLQSNNIRRDVKSDTMTQDIGFNFKWTPNERWSLNFDAQHVDSTVDNLDAGAWASTYQNLDLRVNGDDLPVFSFLPPSNNGTVGGCGAPGQNCPTYFTGAHANFSDPFNSFWRSNMDHIEKSSGKEDALRFDADYHFADGGWLDAIRFGARWAERDQTTRFSTYNWGVLSEQWGGGGPVWLTDPADGIPGGNTPGTAGQPTSLLAETFAFDNFMRGDVPVPTGSQPRLFYASNIVDNYADYSAFGLRVGDEWRARLVNGCPQNWVPLAMRCNVVPGTPFLPQEINPVKEETESAYTMLRFGNEVNGGQRVSGNIGLRWTKTDREARGFFAFPQGTFQTEAQCASIPAGQNPPAFCTLSPTVRQEARNWANGAVTPNTANASFEYWLPSLNVKWQLNDKALIRFGVSKSITPPDIGLTRNYFNLALSGNADTIVNGRPTGNVTVGNAALKPIRSNNYDLSFEYYFAQVGSVTVTAFYKELHDVLTNSTVRTPITNNGATFDVVVTQPVNSPDTGKIRGIELAYQQFYTFLPEPFDGFGINANYTFIDSTGVSQSTLSATDPDVGAGRVSNVNTANLPLQGLSRHNVNFAGIYEKGPWSARLAYNWRSEFLLTVRDVIVPFAPIMNEATGQLDGSLFYTINDRYKIGIQGVNLTNEITKTSQVLNDQLLTVGRSWFMNDRRFTAVIRANF
jgi:TonB-dependent receptor